MSFVLIPEGSKRHKCSCSLFGHATTWYPSQTCTSTGLARSLLAMVSIFHGGGHSTWQFSRVRYRHVSSTACKASASGRTIASIRRSAF